MPAFHRLESHYWKNAFMARAKESRHVLLLRFLSTGNKSSILSATKSLLPVVKFRVVYDRKKKNSVFFSAGLVVKLTLLPQMYDCSDLN